MQRYTVYLYLETALHVSGWYFHPSSVAHTTVSTAYGICHTVTAICRYRGGVGTGLSVLSVAYATHSTLKPENCCISLVIYLNFTMMHGLSNIKFIIIIIIKMSTTSIRQMLFDSQIAVNFLFFSLRLYEMSCSVICSAVILRQYYSITAVFICKFV
jgi:hypothetical protein